MSVFERKMNKKQVIETGLIAVIASLLAGLSYDQALWYRVALGGTVVLLVIPWAFYPVAVLWFTLGNVLGRLTSTVMLTLLFIGLVIPIAWLRKKTGNDSLQTKAFKKNTDSVFVDRVYTFTSTDLRYSF